MNTHADKIQRNKNNFVANDIFPKQVSGGSSFQLEDKRPEAIAQGKLQEWANNSPRAMQLQAFQDKAGNTPQAKADNYCTSYQQQQSVQKKENNTGLPDSLKTGMENLSGMALDDVRVHINSDKPAQLQAHAYAQGTDIHLGPGQEQHLPHEAWHVVQQKQGRVKPTRQMKGIINVNDDAGLEKEADVMGAKAAQTASTNTKSVGQFRPLGSDNSHPVQKIAVGTILQRMISADEALKIPHETDVDMSSKKNEFKTAIVAMEKDWKIVKRKYLKAKVGKEDDPKMFIQDKPEQQMQNLLKYRQYVTVDDKNPDSSIMVAKNRIENERGGKKLEDADLSWRNEGSTDPTSDIDLNLEGPFSELASQYAFQSFREEWRKEAGEVFDVNFYARDWKPLNLNKGLGIANANLSIANTIAKTNSSPKPDKYISIDNLVTRVKKEGEKEEKVEFEGKNKKPANTNTQGLINALASLIRNMENLPEADKTSVKDVFNNHKHQWKSAEKKYETWKSDVKRQKGQSVAENQNLAYAQATADLRMAREKIFNYQEKKFNDPNGTEALTFLLQQARLKAAFYAPEAYVTEASFIHGVINKQMQSTTFKAKEDKNHKVNIKLDKAELLQVVVENVGFALHHVHELETAEKAERNEERDLEYPAVAKYMYRACNALKHLGSNKFTTLSNMAKNTILVKKGQSPRPIKSETKDTDSINKMECPAIIDDLVDILTEAVKGSGLLK